MSTSRDSTRELHQASVRCQARTPIGQLVTALPTKPSFQPPAPPPVERARGRAGGDGRLVVAGRGDDGAEARGAGGDQLPRHGRGAQGLPQRRGPHAPVPGGPLRFRRGRHPRARRRRPVHAAAHGGQHPAGARAARPGRPARGHALLPLQRPRPTAARRDRGGRRHRVRRVHRALRPQPHQRSRLHGTRGEGPRRLPLHHGLGLVPQRRPDRQDQGADREQHQAEQEQPASGRRHEASIRFRGRGPHLPPADHPWRGRVSGRPPPLPWPPQAEHPKRRQGAGREGGGRAVHERQRRDRQPVAAAADVHRDAQGQDWEARRRRGVDQDDAVPPLRPRRQPQGQEVREGHGGQAPARRQGRGTGARRPQGGPGAGRAERRGGVRRAAAGGGGQGRAAPERRPDQRVPDGRDLGGRDHARRRVVRRAEQRDPGRPRREEARGGGDEPGAGGQGAGAAVQAGVHAAARALLQRRARQAALHLLN